MERDDELPPVPEDKENEAEAGLPQPGPKMPEDYDFKDWALI